MTSDFDVQRLARQLQHKLRTEAEMRRGAEIVQAKIEKQAVQLAHHYLAKEFDPDFKSAAHPVDGMPGDFVSAYNKALWERNKNREDFK